MRTAKGLYEKMDTLADKKTLQEMNQTLQEMNQTLQEMNQTLQQMNETQQQMLDVLLRIERKLDNLCP